MKQLTSPSDPDKLCSPIGHSCKSVSSSRFLFQNKDRTWTKQRVSSFRSLDRNFARINNDVTPTPREMSRGAKRIIDQAKANARMRKEYFLDKAKAAAPVS